MTSLPPVPLSPHSSSHLISSHVSICLSHCQSLSPSLGLLYHLFSVCLSFPPSGSVCESDNACWRRCQVGVVTAGSYRCLCVADGQSEVIDLTLAVRSCSLCR